MEKKPKGISLEVANEKEKAHPESSAACQLGSCGVKTSSGRSNETELCLKNTFFQMQYKVKALYCFGLDSQLLL